MAKVSSSPAMPKTDRDYEIREAADALMRAYAIKRDGKLFAAARRELKRRQQEISKALGGK